MALPKSHTESAVGELGGLGIVVIAVQHTITRGRLSSSRTERPTKHPARSQPLTARRQRGTLQGRLTFLP
jgi:hypothetical protein